MIKEIKIPYGGGFSYDGGTIVVGDTKAYFLTMTLPNKAETEYTCLAVNQDNGNYSDDCTISADGLTVSVRMVNSMYNTEGSAKIRLVIMDGEKTVTVKEVNFAVEAENNTETIATDEPNILNTLADVKNRLIALGLNIVESADRVTTQGVYLIKYGDLHDLLLVSKCCDDDIGEQSTDEVTQIRIDSVTHSIYKRLGKRDTGTYVWRDWESIADLSNYYTKSEIDSKISSVYKYKGSVLNPLLLPDSDQTQGEVYNCIIGGGLSKLYKQSTISIASVSHNETKYTITVNFGSVVSSDIYDGGITKPNTVYLTSSMASGYVYGKVTATTSTSITVDYSAYVEIMKKQDESGLDPVYEFANFNAGFPFDTSTFIVTKNTSSDPIQYINTGVNVAWNGSTWDSLGTTIDISGKADKSTTLSGYGIADAYTKTEVDSAISTAIETTLNTEV